MTIACDDPATCAATCRCVTFACAAENLSFWRDARNYRETAGALDPSGCGWRVGDAARLAAARALEQKYVSDDAEEMVNLPSGIQRKILATIKAARADGGAPVDASLFGARDECA